MRGMWEYKPPNFRHQLNSKPQYIYPFSSPCAQSQRTEGKRKHMEINHTFGGITCKVKGAAEWWVKAEVTTVPQTLHIPPSDNWDRDFNWLEQRSRSNLG